jgi:hypothetical protein
MHPPLNNIHDLKDDVSTIPNTEEVFEEQDKRKCRSEFQNKGIFSYQGSPTCLEAP